MNSSETNILPPKWHKIDNPQPKLAAESLEEEFVAFVKSDPDGLVSVKEETPEIRITNMLHFESTKLESMEHHFEPMKAEPEFLGAEDMVKQEHNEPDPLPDSKPLKLERLSTAVKLERPLLGLDLQDTPGDFTPKSPDLMPVLPLSQKKHNGLEPRDSHMRSRNEGSTGPVADVEPTGGEVSGERGHSSESERPRDSATLPSCGVDSKLRHFKLRHRSTSLRVRQSSTSLHGSTSESDVEQDPSWAPHFEDHAPHSPQAHIWAVELPRTRRNLHPQDEKRKAGRKKLTLLGLLLKPGGAISRSPRGPHKLPETQTEAQPHDSGPRPYRCSLCRKAFLTKRDLLRHGRIHSGEKPFSCACCKRRFNDMGNMRKHLLVHSGEKPHACARCGKSFSERSNLRRHQKTHDVGEGLQRFECEACGKSYREKGSLVRHQKSAVCPFLGLSG